jgi:hypothetical protein
VEVGAEASKCTHPAHRGSDPLSGLRRAFKFCESQERLPCIYAIAVILADVHPDRQLDDVARRAGGETEGGARGGRQDLRLGFREHRPISGCRRLPLCRKRMQL